MASPQRREQRLTPRCGAALAASAMIAMVGCGEGAPPLAESPGLGRSALAKEDSETGRRAAAEETAAKDLSCPEVHTTLVFDRKYENSTVVRYAVEGCGVRATYAETCASGPCRYLLLATVSIKGIARD